MVKKVLLFSLFALAAFTACGGDKAQSGSEADGTIPTPGSAGDTLAAEVITQPQDESATIANDTTPPSPQYRSDEARVFGVGNAPKRDLLIVISKKELRLNVYHAPKGGDTTLVAQYPVCLSRNKGNKQRRGDNRTPESPKGRPFRVTQIQPASDWRHDFHDGRGNILAYGDWFIRLETPGFSGIGIHGSTNNEHTVPGRDSEGCIRLRNADLVHFKEHYAYVGMPVIIKAEGEGSLPFETRAKRGTATPIGTAAPARQPAPPSTSTQQVDDGETADIRDPGSEYHYKP